MMSIMNAEWNCFSRQLVSSICLPLFLVLLVKIAAAYQVFEIINCCMWMLTSLYRQKSTRLSQERSTLSHGHVWFPLKVKISSDLRICWHLYISALIIVFFWWCGIQPWSQFSTTWFVDKQTPSVINEMWSPKR